MWRDEWVDNLMDGWMVYGGMNGWINVQMDGLWSDEWMNGWMDGLWRDEWVDECTDEWFMEG